MWADKLKQINRKLSNHLWLDVEVASITDETLVLNLGEDLTYSPRYKLKFEGLNYFNLGRCWTWASTKPFIESVGFSFIEQVNRQYIQESLTEEGLTSLFKLATDEDAFFLVIAAQIELLAID